jgi:hypothetical protein
MPLRIRAWCTMPSNLRRLCVSMLNPRDSLNMLCGASLPGLRGDRAQLDLSRIRQNVSKNGTNNDRSSRSVIASLFH